MKFLRILLVSLLSILSVTENQELGNLYSHLLGVSSVVKHTAKTDENAGVCNKPGVGVKVGTDVPLISSQVPDIGNKLNYVFGKATELINSEGQILINELFDLIEDFFVSDSYLLIKTSEGNRKFSLS